MLLAECFVAEFQKVMQEARFPCAIHCAVGVVTGPVEGYFSKAQVVRYDLFGHGVVLATRYESARQLLFNEFGESAVVILQDKVFHDLPFAKQANSIDDQLAPKSQHIRDDPGARVSYFQNLSLERNFDQVG